MKSIFRRVHLIFVGFLKYKNWPYGHVTWVWMPNLKFKSWMNSACGPMCIAEEFWSPLQKMIFSSCQSRVCNFPPENCIFCQQSWVPRAQYAKQDFFKKIVPPQHERSCHKGLKSVVDKAESAICSQKFHLLPAIESPGQSQYAE